MIHLLLSIHPEHIIRIESGEKTYEFRDYKPKQDFRKVIVYTTKPLGAITHILDIGDIIGYPDQIPEDGVGNETFNDGESTQYEYEITNVLELDDPVSLDAMQDLGVTPPQSYQYIEDDEVSRLGLPIAAQSALDEV